MKNHKICTDYMCRVTDDRSGKRLCPDCQEVLSFLLVSGRANSAGDAVAMIIRAMEAIRRPESAPREDVELSTLLYPDIWGNENPDTPEESNETINGFRASRVLSILSTAPYGPSGCDENVGFLVEFLTDAMHFCHKEGTDFGRALSSAQKIFEDETVVKERPDHEYDFKLFVMAEAPTIQEAWDIAIKEICPNHIESVTRDDRDIAFTFANGEIAEEE